MRKPLSPLAWDAVLKRLPETMHLVPLALGVDNFPNKRQLNALDVQYSRYREMARNIRNKTSSSEETPSSIDTPIMKAVQKLSSTLGQVA